MSYIRQTEFYVGFMRSSPKITLKLGPTGDIIETQQEEVGVEWACPVCGHSNNSGERGPRGDDKCGLCGVSYGKSASMGPNGRATPLSRPSTPVSAQPSSPAPVAEVPVGTCPACTFLNHPSIRNCEICDTPLPRAAPKTPITPTPTTINTVIDEKGQNVIRLSFRKGGSNECYRRLKNVLSDKAWESRIVTGNGNETRGTGIGKSIQPLPIHRENLELMSDGIMQSINLDVKAKDDRMQDAFKDLEVLMVRAGEMVRPPSSLRACRTPS
jgi:ESCRT-II complex subunit VPS36